jgi:hypothetical protein
LPNPNLTIRNFFAAVFRRWYASRFLSTPRTPPPAPAAYACVLRWPQSEGWRAEREATLERLARLAALERQAAKVLPLERERERERTRWTHTGGGKALAFKPTPQCDPVVP